jgi:threonine-phosphate decarboxylase
MDINPFGNPFDNPAFEPDFVEIIRKSSARLTQYPDNRYCEFREAVAGFLKNDILPEQVIPANGFDELIKLILECVLEEGDKVIIAEPAPAVWETYCRLYGAEIIHHPEAETGRMDDQLLREAKILFLSSPSAVSGKPVDYDGLTALAEKCRDSRTLLCIDESLIDLADQGRSIVPLTLSTDFLCVMRSVDALFAVPGIRLGYGVTSPAMAEQLNAARLSWNLGAVSENAGLALLEMASCSGAYLEQSRNFISENRAYLAEHLGKIRNFTVLPGDSIYVLVDMSAFALDSTGLADRLAEAGTLVEDCSSFYSMGTDFLRVTVRPKEDTDRLVRAIGSAVLESARETAMQELECWLASPDVAPAGPNTDCPYYPCHFPGQDCTFCFCPFYPCEVEATGGKRVQRSSGGEVWSCEGCWLVHKPEVVEKLLDRLKGPHPMQDKLKTAWDEVVVPLL